MQVPASRFEAILFPTSHMKLESLMPITIRSSTGFSMELPSNEIFLNLSSMACKACCFLKKVCAVIVDILRRKRELSGLDAGLFDIVAGEHD
jgi:hypothetical protein